LLSLTLFAVIVLIHTDLNPVRGEMKLLHDVSDDFGVMQMPIQAYLKSFRELPVGDPPARMRGG
jgi:hypothetical protein